ncbi:hypothetical protein D3C74_315770 [compost metagenome]
MSPARTRGSVTGSPETDSSASPSVSKHAVVGAGVRAMSCPAGVGCAMTVQTWSSVGNPCDVRSGPLARAGAPPIPPRTRTTAETAAKRVMRRDMWCSFTAWAGSLRDLAKDRHVGEDRQRDNLVPRPRTDPRGRSEQCPVCPLCSPAATGSVARGPRDARSHGFPYSVQARSSAHSRRRPQRGKHQAPSTPPVRTGEMSVDEAPFVVSCSLWTGGGRGLSAARRVRTVRPGRPVRPHPHLAVLGVARARPGQGRPVARRVLRDRDRVRPARHPLGGRPVGAGRERRAGRGQPGSRRAARGQRRPRADERPQRPCRGRAPAGVGHEQARPRRRRDG